MGRLKTSCNLSILPLTEKESAGFIPAQRDNVYDILKYHAGPESPDLQVSDWSKHRAKKLVAQVESKDEAKVELTTSAR